MKSKPQTTGGGATVIATLSILACYAISMIGCGTGNPTDTELDRIPNVPPSSRGTDGGVIEEPVNGR